MIARNTHVIVYRFLDRLTRGRTDGALVRFTIPIPPEGEEAADDIHGGEDDCGSRDSGYPDKPPWRAG